MPPRWMLPVLLFDLDRFMKSGSETDDCEDAEEARRWRCILVGSTPGTLASRANRDKTGNS